MKYKKVLVATIMMVLVTMLLMEAGVVYAVESDSAGKAQVSMNLRTVKLDGNTDITSVLARLTSKDRLLGNQSVDFSVATDFFGQREMRLGTAVTDATGTATIRYQPKWEGIHVVTAHYSGNADFAPSTVTLSLEVPGPIASYIPESVGLLQISQWATLGAGFLVVAVWGLLVFITIYTIKGIVRVHD